VSGKGEFVMSDMSENKIDLVDLERAVTETTGSKAMGRFTRLTFEAAMNLRAGLSREQTSNAMLSHQKNGRRMSARLPFGWKIDPDDPSRMLPDEYELEIIEKVKTLREEGLSYRGIADELADLGFKPRPVKKKFKDRIVEVKGKWHHGTIRSILSRGIE